MKGNELTNLMQTIKSGMRTKALELMVDIGDAKTDSLLQTFLKDEDKWVREQAQKAIEKIREKTKGKGNQKSGKERW